MKLMIYLRLFLHYFSIFCIVFTYLLNAVYIVQIIVSAVEIKKTLRRSKRKDHLFFQTSQNMIPSSILVPAHNEQETVVENIRALLRLDYPEHEVIVINDGSTDLTHQNILSSFHLVEDTTPFRVAIPTQKVRTVYRCVDFPNLVYVDKENGGKADSLNAGINLSAYPLVTTIDADSLLERDALLKLNIRFLEEPSTVAVGGTVRIINGSNMEDGKVLRQGLPKKALVRFQMIEYFRAFFGGRLSWNQSNAILIISGAFGSFSKKALIECRGYSTSTIGEDMEVIVKLHHHFRKKKQDYKIAYILDPICWTQAPEKLADFRSQRRRWQVGLVNTLLTYKTMFLNPQYGKVGLLAVPYFWIFDVIGPIIEFLGYIIIPLSYLFGELSLFYFLAFFVAALLLGMVLSIGGLVLELYGGKHHISPKYLILLMLFALLENFGYRQLATIYRVEGVLKFRHLRHRWGKIGRQTFASTADDEPKDE